jgi:hypothetical protein
MKKPNGTRTISGSWLWFLVIGFLVMADPFLARSTNNQ